MYLVAYLSTLSTSGLIVVAMVTFSKKHIIPLTLTHTPPPLFIDKEHGVKPGWGRTCIEPGPRGPAGSAIVSLTCCM